MTTVSVTDLRTKAGRADTYFSIFQPVTLLSALVNNAAITRGARTIAYDNGTGSGFGAITEGQTIEVVTANGTKKTLIKSITGSQTSGTIELYENGIVWADNLVLRIKHFYEPHPIPPAIRSGVFYKFYSITYANQNSQPNPVAIIGSHRAGFLFSGSITFSLNSSFSYAIANGASISSRVWSCVHNGGGTAGISFSSTTAANPTLTITVADEYWLKCVITDSNGQTVTTYRAIIVSDRGITDPYKDFTIQSFSGDWQSGGWRVSLQATGDVTLADFPDGSLAVLWYENTFNGIAGYVNLWGISDEILTCGYLRQDNSRDNWGQADQGGGTGSVTFQISTIDDLLNNIVELGSVSINAVTSPTQWYEYASWMTTGRSVHHLLLWHAWGIFQCVDVLGLTTNTLGVKTTDYSESSLLQQVNSFAYGRGIFAKLICDRLGRMHLVQDSQMLSDAARAALDTVFTLADADISGIVDVARSPEETTTFTQLDGFSFDGTTSTPFVSIIPGYRESNISYIMPEERGGSTAAVSNQVLADQTDSNIRIGRYHALQNNNPRELRFSNPYNGLGAFDIIPSIGWYSWGIADADLKRNTELNGRKMLCRHVDARFNYGENRFTGIIQTDVVLEPEAIGPPGIQGNYPTGYPATTGGGTNAPQPDWTPPDDTIHGFLSVFNEDPLGTGDGMVIAGSVSGGVITLGSPASFETANNCENMAISSLSATKAVVAYNIAGGTGYGRVVNVSGTTIGTIGSRVSFQAATVSRMSVVGLSATSGVFAYYRASTTRIEAVAFSISGDVITFGTPALIETGISAGAAVTVTRIAAAKVIIAYDKSTTSPARVCIADIAGTVVTPGTPADASPGNGVFACGIYLGGNAATIVYQDTASSTLRAMAIYNISGTTFNQGNDIQIYGAIAFPLGPGQIYATRLDANRIFVSFQDDSSPTQVLGVVVHHDGSGTLTVGSAVVLATDASFEMEYPCTVRASSSKAVIVYQYNDAGSMTTMCRTASIASLVVTDDNNDEIIDAATGGEPGTAFLGIGLLETIA